MITPDSSSKSIKADLTSWLTSLGFERGDPFATVEAEQERILLPEYFVDVDGYERIKGDKTIIVFAPRGGGKSALRVVLASYASPTSPESKSLAIEYTDFAPLIAKLRAGKQITVEDHTNQLLRLAVGTLFIALCGASPITTFRNNEMQWVKEQRTRKVQKILSPVRSRIAQWIRTYQPQLLEPEELYERLNVLDSGFEPDWEKFHETVTSHSLRELLIHSSLGDNESAVFLADLNDFPAGNIDSLQTPKEKFSAFVSIIRSLGFDTALFLVDGIDETEETANDPQAQVDILESLVAELGVLELPGLAFKFFLSLEAHKIILERPTIRRDRITDQAVTVHWSKDDLKHLLDERLAVFSNGTIHELVQICQGTLMEGQKDQLSYLVGELVEEEMLQMSQGSPRRLLLGGQLLFEAHFSRREISGELIELEDWHHAKKSLIRKMPPLLRLQSEERVAVAGEREIGLTPLHHKILLTLANANGVCDRQQLVEKAWGAGEGVSPETIDKNISRIREVLVDDPENPVYLKTIKGQGFQLMNYEIV